jgi:hypothetical protein
MRTAFESTARTPFQQEAITRGISDANKMMRTFPAAYVAA